MTNILLSTYDFNNVNCFDKIKKYIKPGMKAIICPFTHEIRYFTQERLFDSLYHYEYGKDFKILCNAFYDYGVEKNDIYVLNPHRDTLKYMKHKIATSDILFFTGGDPIGFMDFVKAFGLFEDLRNFKGVTMGASAGAMVQMEEFFTYYLPWEQYPYEYHQGLGYIKDIDVLVHWRNDEWQDTARIISNIERRTPFLPLKDGFCMIFNEK